MKIIEQSCSWIQEPPMNVLQIIERCGRVCYKSEDKITSESAMGFVGKIMKSQHESVIEHCIASLLFVTDRGVTHEMVRHRIASYSQESTRYCNYGKSEVTFVLPVRFRDDRSSTRYHEWIDGMSYAETKYLLDLKSGGTPQEARDFLPNSLKTEIVMTANLREWRHFFKLRTSEKAHPQMRDLALRALVMFREKVPVLFDDIIGVV